MYSQDESEATIETPPSSKKVIIVFDDIDRHSAGCACDLCDGSNKSYGYAVFDLASKPAESKPEEAWWKSTDPLIRVYAASEQAAEERAVQHCAENHWTIMREDDNCSGDLGTASAMQDFIVEVREVWIQPIKVRASSREQAIRSVDKGEGEVVEDGFEYSHRLSADTWTANPATG